TSGGMGACSESTCLSPAGGTPATAACGGRRRLRRRRHRALPRHGDGRTGIRRAFRLTGTKTHTAPHGCFRVQTGIVCVVPNRPYSRGGPSPSVAAMPAKPQATTLEGRVLLDRYRLVKKLGAGVAGAVYRAVDQDNDDQVVAVKVLHPVLLDNDELVARFKREAAAMAAIDHPNVCWTSDVHTDSGLLFLVMEYLDGVTLKRRLDSVGRLSPLES